MNVLYFSLLAAALIGLPTTVAAQGGTGSRPFTVEGYVLVHSKRRVLGTEIGGLTRFDIQLTISGNSVQGGYRRNVLAKGGRRVLFSDYHEAPRTLGRVDEAKTNPGYGLVVLAGNTLTMLGTFKTGAYKLTFALGSGSHCRVRLDIAQEVGKGNMQYKGVGGQDLELVSLRPVGSSCRITRG